MVIPCYNEEKLIARTIDGLPEFIDHIIAVNDASDDNTLVILRDLALQKRNLVVLDNEKNGGVGFSLKRGFKYCLDETEAFAIGIVSGDDQCDPRCIEPMLGEFIDKNCDYVKGNRFFQRDAMASMPTYRRIGNIVVSLLAKFSTGYYSISDAVMSFGFIRRSTLQRVDFSLVRDRYDYDNSMLIAMSIVGARVMDVPVPAIYGEETSTLDFWPTVFRVLRVLWAGFWRRIFYKYVFFSLHPIAIFLCGGLLFSVIGWMFALFLAVERIWHGSSPSTGTVMLAALPIILGVQLLLTTIIMDMSNEDRP